MRNTAPVLALLLGLAVAACATPDRIVDTWPIGNALDCPDADARCSELITVGLAGLRSRDVQDAKPVHAQLYREGAYTDRDGNIALVKRSGGCCQVLVVEYADGMERAIGVGYPGVSTTAISIAWELSPPP